MPLNSPRRLFDQPPKSWRELQHCVGRVFQEMACDVTIERTIRIARGVVEVDVFIVDPISVPPAHYVVECKHWAKPIPKTVIHSFRTVVSECGAERGYLISSKGFQSGAKEAANFSNLTLLSWNEFESLFYDRWLIHVTEYIRSLFTPIAQLLRADHAEELWKCRGYTTAASETFNELATRYNFIALWSFEEPNFTLPIESLVEILPPTFKGTKVDTLRKLVDLAPSICRQAQAELEAFWGVRLRRMPKALPNRSLHRTRAKNRAGR